MATKTNAQRLRESWGKKIEEDENTSSSTNISNKNTERLGKVWGAKTIGLDTLQSDLTTTANTIDSVYKGWQTRETMENTRLSIQGMYDRLGKYQEYQKKYGGADLSELQNSYKSVLDGWNDLSKHYSKYKNADAYNNALEEVKNQAKEYEGMKTADLGTVQKEITDLEGILETVKEHESNIQKLSEI